MTGEGKFHGRHHPTSAELAAQWGDPLFSANAIQPRADYQILIDHYRSEGPLPHITQTLRRGGVERSNRSSTRPHGDSPDV
ncbi:hypothetical protein [Amycolatopsis sp. NPDC051903]|uniref:hypothetical protein n=1 Tax=Amycolatopsis sp. NPDC051903 TaxID=3363936 RepID=UPI0037A0ACCA